jgi:hypothetical protein
MIKTEENFRTQLMTIHCFICDDIDELQVF